MHLVIFGLTVSSSWGNGHATLWRSLINAMLRRGHTVVFYEKDVPYYAGARDLTELPRGGQLRLYTDLEAIRWEATRALADADLALCTSFCPDGNQVCNLILNSSAQAKAFYDLDTPVTLDAVGDKRMPNYLPERGLKDFDLVFSFTGGRALTELQGRLGAKVVVPLYGSVDPETHRPEPARAEFRAGLSYLGTYAPDRQESLERLFLQPARTLPDKYFLIGGAQYPEGFPWAANIGFVRHVPPPMHSAFFSSSHATLNVTRGVMARYGYCPSGRLFEAAACGAPLLTDVWEGLETFFALGEEILPVKTSQDVLNALSLTDAELRSFAEAARARVLAEHTGDYRIRQLEQACNSVRQVYA